MDSDTRWELPEPLATCEVQVDADTVTTVRQHGNPDGPRLVLSHGNGLAIDLYYPFWSLLTDEFDIIVYDLRNHGWNALTALERHNLPTMINDHDAIVRAIDENFGREAKGVACTTQFHLWSRFCLPPWEPATRR